MPQKIPSGLVGPIANAIGDVFTFRDLDLILYRCSGDRKEINGLAQDDWPPRKTAGKVIEYVEDMGTTRTFLSLVLEARPANADLRTMILTAMPELAAASVETKANAALVVSRLNDTRAEMRDPAVREAVSTSHVMLKTFADGVDALAAYKYLHDSLHQIQVRGFSSLPVAASAMASSDTAQIERLRDFQDRLRTCVSVAMPWAESLPDDATLRAVEMSWIDKLRDAENRLRKALDDSDSRAARLALKLVERTLEQEPHRINEQIFLMAKRLPLKGLVEALEKARDMQSALQAPLGEACAALRDIRAALLRRVVEHHLWQEADDGLWMLDRVFQTSGTDLVTAFCEDWPATKAMVKNLADAAPEADWAKAILRYADRVDDELTRVEGESAANGQGMGIEVVKGGLYLRYSDFRHEARWHFFAVDQLLKSDCTAIVTIGAPLQSMLKDLGDA